MQEIDGTRLVHANLSVSDEILVLLHSHYPNIVPLPNILASLKSRNEGSVKNKLSEPRTKKLAHGDNKNGYHLMQAGSLIGGSRASSASKSKKPCDL